MALHGVVPAHIRCDNGPEFICGAVRAWLNRAAVGALYIAPGSPWENAYAESYHARLRDEVLNREQFETLSQAQAILAAWREQYNDQRPHSALGYQTPEAFAAAAACRPAGPGSAALRPGRPDGEESMNECCATAGT